MISKDQPIQHLYTITLKGKKISWYSTEKYALAIYLSLQFLVLSKPDMCSQQLGTLAMHLFYIDKSITLFIVMI